MKISYKKLWILLIEKDISPAFTWLRNQIGHLDPNTIDYNEVTTEIDNWYEVLYEITFIALQEH